MCLNPADDPAFEIRTDELDHVHKILLKLDIVRLESEKTMLESKCSNLLAFNLFLVVTLILFLVF